MAITITTDASTPEHACRFVDAKVFAVGQWVELPEPEHVVYPARTKADGTAIPEKTRTKTHRHVLTDTDRRACAAAAVGYLLASGVDEVTIENVEGLYGATAQAASRTGTALIASGKIAERIATTWEIGEAARRGPSAPPPVVRLRLAATWRARLAPLVAADLRARGVDVAGAKIRGKGARLEPVLAACVEDWPGGATWGDEAEHVRDSTGLALACALPPLPGAKRKAGAKRGPRGPRKPRGPLGEEARAARNRGERARRKVRREARRTELEAARAADGCACRVGGRHRESCPRHKPKPGRLVRLPSTKGSCISCGAPTRISGHRRVCPAGCERVTVWS